MSPLRGQYLKGVQWKNDLSPDETTEERSKLCDIDRSSPVIQKYLKSSGEERSKSHFFHFEKTQFLTLKTPTPINIMNL